MCGIFGWSFKGHAGVGIGQREVMAGVLALGNSTRGDQSWGIYARHGQNMRIVKEVGDICKAAFAHNASTPVLMAHTRFSTHGKITKDNAHPHTAGPIILSHNGVIFNHEDLNKKYERHCEVDSQHLALHLAQGLPFTDLEGYGSIEWVDTNHPDTIMLCRMEGGQLAVAGIKNDKDKQVGTVWSSDEDHLHDALDACRVRWFDYMRPIEGKVYEVANGKLFESRHADLTLAARRYTTLGYWQGVTSGSEIAGGHFSTTRAEEREEERWQKYLAASRLAQELGLEQAEMGIWKDEDGEVVTLDDLEPIMQEDAATDAVMGLEWSPEDLEDTKKEPSAEELIAMEQSKKAVIN